VRRALAAIGNELGVGDARAGDAKRSGVATERVGRRHSRLPLSDEVTTYKLQLTRQSRLSSLDANMIIANTFSADSAV